MDKGLWLGRSSLTPTHPSCGDTKNMRDMGRMHHHFLFVVELLAAVLHPPTYWSFSCRCLFYMAVTRWLIWIQWRLSCISLSTWSGRQRSLICVTFCQTALAVSGDCRRKREECTCMLWVCNPWGLDILPNYPAVKHSHSCLQVGWWPMRIYSFAFPIKSAYCSLQLCILNTCRTGNRRLSVLCVCVCVPDFRLFELTDMLSVSLP